VRIVVAMSGGVDSSVAAALLADEGHDVIGLSMQLYNQEAADQRFGSCCTIDDLHDAKRVARVLGIPHYIVNLEQRFSDTVVANFVQQYAAGRTPVPCIHCNNELKFATLDERARGLGADMVATGHYARITTDLDGVRHLYRGADPAKDQGYFLFGLTQDQLARARFPVGDLPKTEVRRIADAHHIPVAAKPDSQEICFVPDGDYAAVVERLLHTDLSGLILDLGGKVVGRHDGVFRFTVGQRKGLGLSTSEPLFVISINAATRTVVVGPRSALDRSGLEASGITWIAGAPPATDFTAEAQIRHRHRAVACRVSTRPGQRVVVEFDSPQQAVTPGQAVVFYCGEEVLGGGWID
jgi:tRNA-uridine 2-sulfurtransferase